MPLPLSELFPDEDYRFHLTLRKGDLPKFFAPADPAALTERRDWLKRESFRYAAATAGAKPLLNEFEAMATEWLPGPVPYVDADFTGVGRLVALGQNLEPDFMLLARDEAGVFRLQAGVVCFPSSWALTEKMGLTLEEIHGVVPGLNPSLASPISQFLGKLKPDAPYERANWGVAATPELNMHPALSRQRLTGPFDPQRIWLRIEDQILAALPQTNGILFGIRIRIFSLLELINNSMLRAGFCRALSSMPDALAAYKGFDLIRSQLIAFLARTATDGTKCTDA